ncbi:response regulator [Maridesulfovibrio zosterae]|uniref:response regulator n=1 Tax=Maridesulfovibrio zosterae TaxID=82171 RepID=UPI0003FB46AC|nr:response regulator [Maridesulfovibrio zosterae]
MEQMKIMLVDDEESLLSTTKELFEKMGFYVFTSTSGKNALEQLRTEKIDVIILDIKMPGTDGMDILQRIKKDYPLTEVIILTGHGTMKSAIEGLKRGAMDFLVKPASMKDILSKVEEAIEKIKRHKQKIISARMADSKDAV